MLKTQHNAWVHASTTLLILCSPAMAPASIPDFFNELFEEVRAEYSSLRESEFSEFCSAHGIDSLDATNRQTFLRIHFLHDLLTTVSASDCSRGGFLRIPYFWHWVEPNPRHAIILLPDSTQLSALRPHAPYDRYATQADIDRVPVLFLGDLIEEAPGYSHPECGSFFSFGWCSEREMSFTALMVAWGYVGKIWQSGIHTYFIVWCELKRLDETAIVLAANVDNTFGSITWQVVPRTTEFSQWLQHIGTGAQIAWYNQKARSPGQIEALRNTPVGESAKVRIQRLVHMALSGEE